MTAFGASAPAEAQEQLATQAEDRVGTDNHVTIGFGGAALPDFQGARHYTIMPAPIVDVEEGRFFARSGDGIGVNAIDTPNFQAGVSLTWMRGYDADDVPAGIGKLKSTLGGRAFVSGQFAGFSATLSAIGPIFGGDAEGATVNARISRPVRVTSRLTVSPAIGVTWADRKFMRRYFGVDARQAAASGLAEYHPSSGFRDIDGRLAVSYRLTNKISLVAVGLVSRNLDRVTDSPFVERRWQPAGVLGLAYTF